MHKVKHLSTLDNLNSLIFVWNIDEKSTLVLWQQLKTQLFDPLHEHLR